MWSVSYTHLRAHETLRYLVCRLLLEKKITAIKDFEMGTNNSPEGLDKGFTHCFVVTFTDEQGRKEYLPHPEHKKFLELLKSILDDVFVIDYWAVSD